MQGLTRNTHGPYTAVIGGSAWENGPRDEFRTITDARAWAKSFGTSADWCNIIDPKGRVVAKQMRDGNRWIKAEPNTDSGGYVQHAITPNPEH